MQGFNLPYQPIPQKLYTGADLFQGFDPSRPDSWAKTADFEIYRHFVSEGGTTPANPYMGMMQALHDNAITQATAAFVKARRVVAIIGDHKLARDSAAYRNTAVLARRLTRSGMLICTGGGPGAMEAGHLGAALAGGGDAELDSALDRLKPQPVVPALGKIVDPRGGIDSRLVDQAFAWFKPAFEIAQSIRSAGESLALPTWHYGHEPSTPFATHIAKYFQNSIREDGLLAIAQQGIVCMEGKAGTIQEIFQDSAQNYYQTFGQFSPMVLFGVGHWTTTYPVVGVLKKLFAEQFSKYVLVTDDVDAAARFIERFSSQAGRQGVGSLEKPPPK
jgi:predicted Rossmann-fold nucleotide-binding protein